MTAQELADLVSDGIKPVVEFNKGIEQGPCMKVEMTFEYESEKQDCERIVRIFAERGEEIDLAHAYIAWERVSQDSCAGWLHLSDDDQMVYDEVKNHL